MGVEAPMSHPVRTWFAIAAVLASLAACGSGTDGGTTPSPSATASPTGTSATTPTPTTPTTAPPTSPTPTTRPPSTPAVPTPTRTTTPPAPTACQLTAEYRGQDLTLVPTTSKVAVLTFDGGASSTGVASILTTLAAKRAAATFFLTGDFVRDHPASARSISAAYPVGNHSDTHPDLTTLPSTRVVDEVRDGAAAIRAVTGRAPGPWFRFPYGARDSRTIGLVNDECYVAVRWTVDSLGWKGTSGGMTVASVRDRVLAAARPGMIVLMHVGANPDDGTTLDAAALPAIIDGLRARGYRFVTLQQAL
jgi:peptidoglycan/xylan/chitin deacetylase (PgdA/CDA1 family)